MNVAHLSDTHFGTENPAVVKALHKRLCDLNIDLVVVSGDITQRARVKQFKAAKAFFDSLPARRVLSIPGNHDIPLFNLPARLLWPFRNYQTHLCSELQPMHSCNKLWLMCLNTVQRHKHTNGCVSKKQMDWVTQQLRAAPEHAIKIVVTHHPFAVILRQDSKNLIKGAHTAIDQWSRAGLDLVLGGHIHFPFTRPLNRYIAGLQGDPWVIQAGTAISKRIRNNIPNSFFSLRLGQGRMGLCIQRWDYSSEQNIFFEARTITPWN